MDCTKARFTGPEIRTMSMRCLRVPAGCPAVERKTRTAPIGGDTPIFPREGMKSPSAQLRLPAVLLRQPREGRTSGIEPTLRSADGWYAIDFLGAGSHPGSRLPGREVGRPSVEVWCSQPAGQVRPVGARHQHGKRIACTGSPERQATTRPKKLKLFSSRPRRALLTF